MKSENVSLNLMLEGTPKVSVECLIILLHRLTLHGMLLTCIVRVPCLLEMLEASFDIVQDASSVNQPFLEAEAVLVLCRVIKVLAPVEDRTFNLPPIVLRSPLWFLVSSLIALFITELVNFVFMIG